MALVAASIIDYHGCHLRSPKIIAQIDLLHSRIETLVTVYQLEKSDGSDAANQFEGTKRSRLWVNHRGLVQHL
jgi:hypothetical protein